MASAATGKTVSVKHLRLKELAPKLILLQLQVKKFKEMVRNNRREEESIREGEEKGE